MTALLAAFAVRAVLAALAGVPTAVARFSMDNALAPMGAVHLT